MAHRKQFSGIASGNQEMMPIYNLCHKWSASTALMKLSDKIERETLNKKEL